MSNEAPEEALGARDGTGFFGKLPSHGDFVSRRLPAEFMAGWEAWLDGGLDRSRSMLGNGWLAAYLSCPIWRFVASARCCGDIGFAGVWMPSVDRVGRYYPLSIIAVLDAGQSAVRIALEAGSWFQRIETAALSCLVDGFDFTSFDTALQSERLPELCGRIETPEAAGPGSGLALSLGRLLDDSAVRYSLWSVSESPAATWRAFGGLPEPEDFVRMLG